MPRFAYERIDSWPPLAWIAVCKPGSDSIDVFHGGDIERREDWFCEAVWDGPFSDGDFDRTDLVFGSGARRRGDDVLFVSPGSAVDRLQIAVRDDCAFISNSLAGLLETSGARPDTAFQGFAEFFATITRGIDEVSSDLPVLAGTIRLVYHDNVRWDGRELHVVSKPRERRDFGSFDKYVGFMRAALGRIAGNMSSDTRMHPWSWLGTISRGYDSATCAALAREAGLERVLTHDESRPDEPDDGTAVARALNLRCLLVNRLTWKRRPLLEPLFLAGDAQGKEIMIAGAQRELRRTVLVTGHCGDIAWSTKPHRFGEHFARRAHSGLSMTEYRLHAGFIHLPVPFMGLRQQPDLVALSQSPEMRPWSIGGSYDRPICRRTLEEAGVPRESFGISKAGASIRFLRGEDGWSRQGKQAFFGWLRRRRTDHTLNRRSVLQAQAVMWMLERTLLLRRRTRGGVRHYSEAVSNRLAARIKTSGLNDLAFVWAMEIVRKSYQR
jgi:hypothetical protein